MNAHPKISVIMPVYNSAQFVGPALQSILDQDYPNIEIVVSDDCSRDGSQAVIEKFKAKYPEKIVAFLNPKNLGIARNCNQCLNACTGELVALFAGDDIMLPGKLTKQAAMFVADPELVMAYHPVELFDSDTDKTIYITNQSAREDTNSASDIIRKMGIAGGMSLMVRRTAIPTGGYDETLPYASDWLFHIEVALRGKVKKLDEVLCRYRKYGENNGKSLASYIHEFEKVLNIVESRHKDRADIVEACRAGRARFLAGEGFRQLSKDIRQARALFAKAIKLQPFALKYYLAYLVASNRASAAAMPYLKYRIKRFVS